MEIPAKSLPFHVLKTLDFWGVPSNRAVAILSFSKKKICTVLEIHETSTKQNLWLVTCCQKLIRANACVPAATLGKRQHP